MTFWRAQWSNESEKDRAYSDVALARRIGEVIDAHYPGHFFRTEVDSKGGVVQIKHPLMPPQCFYILKLKDLASDPGLTQVKRAAGELLERISQPRSRRREDLWYEARQKHRRSMFGFHYERNWKTGEAKFVMPDEWKK